MTSPLQEKAILVRLHMKTWTGRKMDADETRRVNDNAGAEDGAARVYKTLVKKDRISALKNVTEKVREEHYKVTLPWDDKGVRLLPITKYESYRATMDRLFEKRNEAIKSFMDGYQDAITEAQDALGTLFNEDVYPSEIQIKRRMVAEYEFTTVPDERHFVAQVSAEEADKIKRQIQKFTEKRIKGAISDIYRRLSEAITTLGRQVNPDDEGTRVFCQCSRNRFRRFACSAPILTSLTIRPWRG